MAKKTTKKAAVNLVILQGIASGNILYISQEDGLPLLENDPQLIEVNPEVADPSDPNKRAVRLTDAGLALIKPKEAAVTATTSSFGIIDNAVPPESKRGGRGGGAPKKYPFDDLGVNQSFFVAASADLPEPLKTLGSTVSSANHRYSTPTGEYETKERAKRGPKNKAVRDEAGNKIMETVQVEKREPVRKFTIRGVKAGVTYGGWTAPADGALITRTL